MGGEPLQRVLDGATAALAAAAATEVAATATAAEGAAGAAAETDEAVVGGAGERCVGDPVLTERLLEGEVVVGLDVVGDLRVLDDGFGRDDLRRVDLFGVLLDLVEFLFLHFARRDLHLRRRFLVLRLRVEQEPMTNRMTWMAMEIIHQGL